VSQFKATTEKFDSSTIHLITLKSKNKMSEIVLNPGQESAISQIKSWWPSNQRFFVLHGAAGSGKSLITKYIVESLENCSPLLTAPTNAACRQIEKYFPKEFEIKTTYAALGFHFNQSSEQKYLTRIGIPGFLGDYNLITVDEASFIGDSKKCKLPNGKLISLLDAIMEVDAKVLFIGHKSQLPEVDENSPVESPIFQQGWPRADLIKIERNSGELQSYIEYIESLIYKLNKRFENKYPLSLLEQIKYIKSLSGVKELKSGHSRIIAYRNKTVDELNISIRNSIFGNLAQIFMEEDNIILTEPVNYIGNLTQLNERNALRELINKVQFSSNTEFKILKTKKVFVFGIKCWEIEVKSEDEKGLLYSPIDMEKFLEFKNNLKLVAFSKTTKVAKDKAFKNYHNLVSLFMTGWKYSYAVTVHRIQGSNVNKPIVLWDDIRFCQNVPLRHKLLYVACSRAREELLIKG